VEALALGRKLRLNEASEAELESLPGVGPSLARRIVAARPYRAFGDLDRVRGIGPAKLRTLAPLVEP
jgi:competence protein ComEA